MSISAQNPAAARDTGCKARALLSLPETRTGSLIGVQQHLSVSELKDWEKPPPTKKR